MSGHPEVDIPCALFLHCWVSGGARNNGTMAASASDQSGSLDSLIHRSVRVMTAQFQTSSQPDICALSSFAYVNCNPDYALALASINKAMAYTSAPATAATKPSVCVAARDMLADAIKRNISVTDVKPTASTAARASIMKGFYEGPRNIAASFMRQKLANEYGISLAVTDESIISAWFDFAKDNLVSNELSMMQQTPDVNTPEYKKWVETDTVYSSWLQVVTMAASTYLRMNLMQSAQSNGGSASATHASEVISTLNMSMSQSMVDSIVNFVFRPWLTLYFIQQFATNKAFNIHTQVYAYKLFVDVASRAINMVAETYTPADANLKAISATIGTLIPTEVTDVDSWSLKVVQKSMENRKATIDLQAINATAGQRLQRSGDMQLRFQILDGQVAKQKQLMMMWIIALLVALASSTFLVVTDHTTAFLLLAAGSIAIMLCVVAVPMLFQYLKRKTNSV